MSENVSFLYPITRVGSLYHLLRSTTHSAFPVVTPLTSQGKPLQNVSSMHVPALYRDDFTLSGPYGATNAKVSPVDEAISPKQPGRYKRTTFTNPPAVSNNKRSIKKRNEAVDACSAQLNDGDGLEYNYSIPATTALMSEEFHTQSMKDSEPLVLHGMILRTQLIQLLKNKVFFSDSEQVLLGFFETLLLIMKHREYYP